MEGIKIWQLDGSRAIPLASANRLRSEQMLEEALVENPHLLLGGLTLVGRQTPTDGGPLDLLGVDQDGRLAVFELKRGTLSRDAVAQVIDYASHLDHMDLEELAGHIGAASGAHGIDKIENFGDWYGPRFGELESLKPLRLFLVGLGVDDRTERMVRFLANNSAMDISLLTFHGFDQGGKSLLAKQVEVEPTDNAQRTARRRRRSRQELQQLFDEKLGRCGVPDLFHEVKGVFETAWPRALKRPNVHGLVFKLQRPTPSGRLSVQYARVSPNEDEVNMVFFPRAVRLRREEFRPRVEEVPHKTWPPGREALPANEDDQPEIQFQLTPEVWDEHKASLTELAQAVYEAWEEERAGEP